MKILVVGSGGREYVLVLKLAQSPEVTRLYCAPGSDAIRELRNASNEEPVQNLPFVPTDAQRIADFARENKCDLVVPGPESCLEAGLGDWCRRYGVPFAGPCSRGARFETSKAFTHQFCNENHIPQPQGQICETVTSALAYLNEWRGSRFAVKADGLASGKGVLLPTNHEEAQRAVKRLMVNRECGEAGARVVLQHFEFGRELSLHAIADGKKVFLLETARDYKKSGEGDTGENTGGMGGYSPAENITPELHGQFLSIIRSWQDGCEREEISYRGVLYPGLIVTMNNGVKVLEFNARFGDPEAQAFMLRFRGDLAKLLYAAATDSLYTDLLQWSADHSVCVVLASRGYPGAPEIGKEISGLEDALRLPSVQVFHSGTRGVPGRWYTNGGRVLTVGATGKTLEEARKRAYHAVSLVSFEGMHFRKRIAAE